MTFNQEVWTGELLKQPSGWEGLECYMKSIISSLNIKTDLALEFGIDHGYSLTVLRQLFTKTIGVDSFTSDPHTGHPQGSAFFQDILNKFKDHNVDILKLDYREFIKDNNNQYDLVHVDIVHHYAETFECVDWAIQHSNVVIVHDTLSFPEMHKVCVDVTNKHNVLYSNILHHNGLGVVYRI